MNSIGGATTHPATTPQGRQHPGAFIALEGPNGAGKSTLAPMVADLDYPTAVDRLESGDPARGMVWLSRKQPTLTCAYTHQLMLRLAQVLWELGSDPVLPDRFWAEVQAAWFTAYSATVLEPLLEAGFDIVVDGWIGRISTHLLTQGGHTPADLETLFAQVRRPDRTVLVDVDPSITWQREHTDKPTDLGMHTGTGNGDPQQDHHAYQWRTLQALRAAAATHGWHVLPVEGGETPDDTAARMRLLLTPDIEMPSSADTAGPLLRDLAPADHYRWPSLRTGLSAAVITQLGRSLSDRDATGVIGEFEAAFAGFVGARYAVAFASGTAGIHAMCRAAGLRPGDEIVAPAYTFAATASPFAFDGVKVVFADADPDTGNVTAESIAAALTPRTRAVIVTHLWGIPCRMDEIAALTGDKGLLLLEDCSHAHFASWRGRHVGLWGDMAVFSCNQKAITTGEGGVLVTSNPEMRDKALLFGHYGKRSAREIDQSAPYSVFAMTGMGLKERITTVGAAIGVHELARAVDIEQRRRTILDQFVRALADDPVLDSITLEPADGEHGLYVLGLIYQQHNATVTRDEFVRRCHVAGALEVDVPGSTGDITAHPLFARTDPHADWSVPIDHRAPQPMPGARAFADRFLKLPLWGYPGDTRVVDAYLSVITDTAHAVRR